MISVTIDPETQNMRLDRFIRQRLPLTTLPDIFRLIRKGSVKVNGKKSKENYRCALDDVIEIYINQAEFRSSPQTAAPVIDLIKTAFFKKNFNVVFEDEHVLICNKPSGLVVHSGSGHDKHDTLIDCAKSYLANKNKGKAAEEPSLIHRIDRDTSGIIVLGKSKQFTRHVSGLIRKGEMVKRYMALVHGSPPERRGVIEVDLERVDNRDTGSTMKVVARGQHSISKYDIIKSNGPVSLVEVELGTGRTHQIRVHMAHIGCPIVGDDRYGDPARDAILFEQTSAHKRLYLHAAYVSFFYPQIGRDLKLSVPMPEEFEEMIH